MDTNEQPSKTPASASWILWGLVAAYFISPIDAIPGPADDWLIVGAAITYRKELAATIHTFLRNKIGGDTWSN